MRNFDKKLFDEMMNRCGFKSLYEHLTEGRVDESVYDYSNTQIELPVLIQQRMQSFAASIPEDELYIDPEDPSFGREKDPHVTVRYGLDTSDPTRLMEAFKNFGWIDGELGDVSIFAGLEDGKYDVVKVEIIDCPWLIEANKLIGETEPVPGETHPDYKPHATIAYVKAGVGKKYEGDDRLRGLSFSVNEIILRAKDGRDHVIPLGER
jgi:2'-5' RNA ligase